MLIPIPEETLRWIVYALLSAVFASPTAIRTLVVVVMAWAVVFFTGQQKHLGDVTGRNLLFLVL